MTCINRGEDSACPFAFSDKSEQVQNYGCLPTPYEIITMRVEHGKTWACHETPSQPCIGTIRMLKRRGLPHKVVDPVLMTETMDWHLYVTASERHAQDHITRSLVVG